MRFVFFLSNQGLFRNYGLVFVDNFIDQLYILIREKTKKQESSHRIAAEIIAGLIRGSKNWTLEMVFHENKIVVFH